MTKKNVCIIGGGATGVSLLWALSQDSQARQDWDISLIHNQENVGGHSLTKYIPQNGKTFPVDIGVQFISPMMYPNVHVMLQRPEFKSRVPMNDYESLKIACAFPPLNGQPMNWGNFPEYQQGSNFTLYNSDMKLDIAEFQAFIEVCLLDGWGMKTLEEYFFTDPPKLSLYPKKMDFINYILSPYLSIINGYGSALLNETTFIDMFPLFATLPLPQSWGFPTPLGSFSKPGTGWQRFANGAQSWVEAMNDVAQSYAKSNIILNSSVTAVWTDQNTNQVTVQWLDGSGQKQSQIFDKVVLTTDMWTNSKILNNPQNQYYWNNVYNNPQFKNPIGYGRDINMNPLGSPVTWDLMWGKCYIHTDSSMLSPDLMQQEETLQFTAYYAPGTDNGNYNLIDTYTTYIQKNVLNDPDADGLYLTMYGYIPDESKHQKLPDPNKVLYSQPWTHGRWTPSAMDGPKTNLYMAQGLGNISYPGQLNTNVYFAGNNTTVDSEDGALMSAMAIANYAFGVNYPLAELSPESLFAFTMYNVYHNVMFPKQHAAHAITSLHQTLPQVLMKVQSEKIAAAPTGIGAMKAKKRAMPKKAASRTKSSESKKKSSSQKAPTKTTRKPLKPNKASTKKVIKKGALKPVKVKKKVTKKAPAKKTTTNTKRKLPKIKK
ncbi:MAG TPA: hypothetical protein DCX53_02420, partial [Anaerolineae bacterium]|nr:hypothetical protein [Anaerolineae bacterium]